MLESYLEGSGLASGLIKVSIDRFCPKENLGRLGNLEMTSIVGLY